MISKIIWQLNADKTISKVTKNTNKLFANGQASTEYDLIANLPTTDTVIIVANRNGQQFSQRLKYGEIVLEDNTITHGWSVISNGAELNFDLQSGSAEILFNFDIKRFSTLNLDTVMSEFTTQQDSAEVFPASTYYPQATPSDVEMILSDINTLENDKQDKVDSSLDTENKTVVGAINSLKSAVDINTGDITDIKAEQITQNTNIQTNTSNISSHTSNTNNPHQVTKAQIGLGNVDNTSDLSKPVSTATQTELNKKVDKTTTTDVSVNKIVNSGSYPYGIGILSSDKTDVNGIYSSVGVDKDKILLISAKTGASSNLTFTPDKLELIQSNFNAGTYLRSNVATENYVDTSIQNAISGAVIYKGIWTTTTQTTTYSALNSFRPIKSGWRWEVGGTGCSIDNVQYLPTDFITFNQDCGEDTTITTAMIDKTDNTDSVTSVNGQVGNVVLSASDIGATTQSYVDTQDTNLQTQITANATDINEKEDKSNKVTSLSSASTDTQYPSAKCVYDIVGNIVSLMEEL